MIKIEHFAEPGKPPLPLDPARISDALENPNGMVWLDLESPSEEDYQLLVEEFQFHQLAMDDLRQKDQRAKVVDYEGYTFVVMHELRPGKDRQDLNCPCLERGAEVNTFTGQNFCVTVHDGPSPAVTTARQRWEASREMQDHGPYAFLYLILDSLVDDYYPTLDAFDERIDLLEELVLKPADEEVDLANRNVTAAEQRKPLKTLLGVRRELLEMRRYVAPMRDAINTMLRHVEAMQDPERAGEQRRADRARALYAYYQDVFDHTIRIVETIDTYRDLLSGTLDAHLAVASNRLNEIVKVLTSISIIMMSWATVSGIYGMNFEHMPELHWRYGYAYVWALLVAITIGEFIYFRKRKWL
jgi:magnesium transporter